MCKTLKQQSLFLETYYFQIIIKNLTKSNILKAFAPNNKGKFADHDLEKLCSRSLASTIPVLDLEKVCPWTVCPCLCLDFFRVLGLGLKGWVLESISADFTSIRIMLFKASH